MEWINTSKTFEGTKPNPNSFILVLDGFFFQLSRENHIGSWRLKGWGEGIELGPVELDTKDPTEAGVKASVTAPALLKEKIVYMMKLMNEVNLMSKAMIKQSKK